MVSLSRSARRCWACSQGSGPKAATPLPPPGAATTVSPSECRAAIKAHAARSATGSAACTSSARRPCSGPEGRGDHQCLDPSRHPVSLYGGKQPPWGTPFPASVAQACSTPCTQAKEQLQWEAAETTTDMSPPIPLPDPLPSLRDRHGGRQVAVCPLPPPTGFSPSYLFPYTPTYPVRQANMN